MTRIHFSFLSPFFCTRYSETKAEIQFLYFLNCFFEFSVFLVSVLNEKKCLEVTESCIGGNFLSFNTDTKNTENSKRQFKNLNFSLFSHSVPLYQVQKNGEKIQKNDICAIYPGHKCKI